MLRETLVSAVSSALPMLSSEGGGCRAAPGCLRSAPTSLSSSGLVGSDRTSSSVLILLRVTHVGQ